MNSKIVQETAERVETLFEEVEKAVKANQFVKAVTQIFTIFL